MADVNVVSLFFLMTRNPLMVWASGTTLEGQTPDVYTPPLSRRWVNRKMPQLGVKPEIYGFTNSPDIYLTAEAPQAGEMSSLRYDFSLLCH